MLFRSAFAREALTQALPELLSSGDARIDDSARTLVLDPPKDLRQRYRYLPPELRRTAADGVHRLSTDKAAVPTSIMGATKRLAELTLPTAATKDEPAPKCSFATVRFGNVMASSGSVIPLFRKQVEAGGPITVTHKDATRYFMTIPEAAELVLQSAAMTRGSDLFVLDMGKPFKILELAKRIEIGRAHV